LGNPNLVKVEVGTAIGVLGHRAYGAVLLVIAYEQFGKFGAPLFATVRLLGGAVGVLVYSALAGRFRREHVLAGGFLANAVAVALLIPVLHLHTANGLLLARRGACRRTPDPCGFVLSGPSAVLITVVACGVLGAVYSLWRLRKVERQAPTNREEVDAIRGVDAFRPLSVAAANHIAAALIALQAAGGQVVVQQGEAAEDMFLIASGVFEAEVDGKQVRTLHPGDHFGEIALLFHAPRTATVQCAQAGALWWLRRDDFLRAVTGNSTTEEAMTAIANQRLTHAGSIRSVDTDY
jgi:hypothetical protein